MGSIEVDHGIRPKFARSRILEAKGFLSEPGIEFDVRERLEDTLEVYAGVRRAKRDQAVYIEGIEVRVLNIGPANEPPHTMGDERHMRDMFRVLDRSKLICETVGRLLGSYAA